MLRRVLRKGVAGEYGRMSEAQPHWKAKGPKPRTRFCWLCSRQLYGRQHVVILGPDGNTHPAHISCASEAVEKGEAAVL